MGHLPITARAVCRRPLVAAVAAWALLTIAGTWLMWAAWNPADGAAHDAAVEHGVLKPLANLVDTALAPVWIAGRFARGGFPNHERLGTLLVGNALGWGLWIAAAVVGAGLLKAVGRRAIRAPVPRPIGRLAGAPDSGRRKFLFSAPCAVAGLGGVAALPKGTLLDPWGLCVRRYSIPIAGLPASLDGLRIVQISDTHLGPRIPAAFIGRAVGLSLELRPDVVALTGDYIHMGDRMIGAAAELFRPIVRSGVPVVGVLGNHEWYGDAPAMRRALEAIGVAMLDNGRVFLDAVTRRLMPDHDDRACLCIAGVGDLLEDVVDAHAALGGVPPHVPRLVLAHNPDTAEIPAFVGVGAPRVDLMLSGHTHGGQVRLPLLGTPGIPSAFGQRYAGGLCRGPRFPVVVSRGVGMSIIPVRFGVPPEIVEITLARA